MDATIQETPPHCTPLLAARLWLVHATDFEDNARNRAHLVTFIRGAHTAFCEFPFREAKRAPHPLRPH